MRALIILIKCHVSHSIDQCPTGYVEFNGNCYIFYPAPRSWWDSFQICASQGANLVSILDGEENEFVVSALTGDRRTWIGLIKLNLDNTWVWSDNSPLEYNELTGMGIGNDICAVIHRKLWFPQPCERFYPFICKTAASYY